MADSQDVATDLAAEIDMTQRYNTKLSPLEERSFGDWANRQRAKSQRDPREEMYDYDIKGWWKQAADKGSVPDLGVERLADQWKKPNHPTFSDESIYHGMDGHEGGHWQSIKPGQLGTPTGGNQTWTFTPGKSNLEFFSGEELHDYFSKREPNSKLIPRQEFGSNEPLLPEEMKVLRDSQAYEDPRAIPPIAFMRAGQYVKTGDLSSVTPSANIEQRQRYRGGEHPIDYVAQFDLRRQTEKEYGGSAMGESLVSMSNLQDREIARLMELGREAHKTPLPRRRPKGK